MTASLSKLGDIEAGLIADLSAKGASCIRYLIQRLSAVKRQSCAHDMLSHWPMNLHTGNSANHKSRGLRFETGATRFVILILNIAIKLPKLHSRWSFRKGFEANRKEHVTWQTRHSALCPILWSDRFGFMVIMRRAEPIDRATFQAIPINERIAMISVYGQTESLPVEMKASSFGWLNGRLVAVDYGEIEPTIR